MKRVKRAVDALLDLAEQWGEDGMVPFDEIGPAAQLVLPGLLADGVDGWLLGQLQDAWMQGAIRAVVYEAEHWTQQAA